MNVSSVPSAIVSAFEDVIVFVLLLTVNTSEPRVIPVPDMVAPIYTSVVDIQFYVGIFKIINFKK